MRRRSRFRDTLEYSAARLVLASLEHLPRRMADRLARLYAGLLDLLVPRLRKTALRNLAMAMPELSPAARARIADENFRSIARLLVAMARFPRMNSRNISEWICYDGYAHFERALQRGKGVLFATAHLGNWELSAFAHALLSAPMHVLVRPLDNPAINALVERRRTLCGNRVIHKKEFARGILKALARNEAVGVLIDQNAAPDEGVFVDFFGIPACASAGFARLAARSGAAVIPGYALWIEQEQRYRLRFEAPVEMSGDAAEDTRRLHARLEAVVRAYPGQWLWIHRRWKTRPPGQPPLY